MAGTRIYEPPPDAAGAEVETILQPDGTRRQVVRVADHRTLTERMFAKAPADGYRIWIDLADPAFIYIAEAPLGTADGTAVFRGVRMPTTVGGEVRERFDFAWSARGTGW